VLLTEQQKDWVEAAVPILARVVRRKVVTMLQEQRAVEPVLPMRVVPEVVLQMVAAAPLVQRKV